VLVRKVKLSAAVCLGSGLLNKTYRHGFVRGPLRVYKRHRVIERVLNGVFGAAQ
jgi:hypothetical protein